VNVGDRVRLTPQAEAANPTWAHYPGTVDRFHGDGAWVLVKHDGKGYAEWPRHLLQKEPEQR
jgi:hypothetical protein